VSFLLDTNVVSEWVKPRPDLGVMAWFDDVDSSRVFLSVVTLAELRYGIDRMPNGVRRNRLDVWLRDQLPRRFDGRILPVSALVAEAWGQVVARCQAKGRAIGIMDAFLAATAEVHTLTVVTRNTSHFEVLGGSVLNPWTA
jgi:predicted nucleic acid-binding protein